MTEVQTALRLDASDADAKNLEVQIKALQKEQTASQKTLDNNKKKSGISGIFTQIKDILNKKL